MGRTLKLLAAGLALACACLLFRAEAGRPPQSAVAPPRATLTEQERRGKEIFLRGQSTSGREIVGVVGELDVPGATVTCAGCHGQRGEGKTEGGVTAGSLTWSNLLKPYGHTHPSGRRHGPFNESSFVRAVANGLDPDGNELLVAMPRYRMAAEDMADLVAYLKRVESDRDPGLTEDSIIVGLLAPARGPLAEVGAAMREVLDAYFREVSARGGVYSRRLSLRAAPAGPGAAAAAEARAFIEREQPFALVGGVTAGAERELAAVAAEHETPFVGPSALLPQAGPPLNRQVFYLMPGVAEQARALAIFAASRPGMKGAGVAVVAPAGELYEAAAAAFERQARQAGLGPLTRHAHRREGFDAARLAAELKAAGAGVVFFLGGGAEASALLREAASAAWTPHLLALGVFTAGDLTQAVTPAFRDRVFVAFPFVPSALTSEGTAEFAALRAKYNLPARHSASQLAAFAAGKVFVEALKRAGQDLSRERLIAALEGLYDFETGVTPRLTFGPNRRVGAAGAYILTIDPEKKEYASGGGWVRADDD